MKNQIVLLLVGLILSVPAFSATPKTKSAAKLKTLFGIELGTEYKGVIGECQNTEAIEALAPKGLHPDNLAINRDFTPVKKFLSFDHYSFSLTPNSKICMKVMATTKCETEDAAIHLQNETIVLMEKKFGITFKQSPNFAGLPLWTYTTKGTKGGKKGIRKLEVCGKKVYDVIQDYYLVTIEFVDLDSVKTGNSEKEKNKKTCSKTRYQSALDAL